jgi:rod shape-determining protein MreB
MTGLPSVVSINTTEILEAFEELSERIIETIHHVLENTPPELVADVSQNGIVLTGGGSLLWGFDKLIESRTSIPTRVADDAELCVAYGLAKSLQNINEMHEGTINLARRKQMKT